MYMCAMGTVQRGLVDVRPNKKEKTDQPTTMAQNKHKESHLAAVDFP